MINTAFELENTNVSLLTKDFEYNKPRLPINLQNKNTHYNLKIKHKKETFLQ